MPFTKKSATHFPNKSRFLIASLGVLPMLLLGCQKPNTQNNPSQEKNTQTASSSKTDDLRLAVASNLANTLPAIISKFKQTHPSFANAKIDVSYASSGKLFTQITQNAPYDVFLAANQDFPAKLVESQGKYGKPFTYTKGQLALYSSTQPLQNDAVATLQHYFVTPKNPAYKLAIANPQLAPYGKSAQVWLDTQHLTPAVKDHLVTGDNIEQTFAFANTGNADFGLVAVSQLIGNPQSNIQPVPTSQYRILPVGSYPQIKQDGLILHPSATSEAFVKFLLSPQAQAILIKSGYLPTDNPKS